MSTYQWTCDHSGPRLDAWLAQKCPELSRSRLQQCIDQGMAQVNGASAKRSYSLHAGDVVTLKLGSDSVSQNRELRPITMPLEILFEDESIIALNKPSGLVVHPGAGTKEPTMVEGVLAHVGHLPQTDPSQLLRPGVVHRLDKDTTGAIVFAKTEHALLNLQQQFAKKQSRRTYMALLEGCLENDITIESELFRDPRHRQKFSSRPVSKAAKLDEGNIRTRWAKSVFCPVTHYDNTWTLVRVHLYTGRTHQIRVHAKTIGHPVVGDPLYGEKRSIPARVPVAIRRTFVSLRRQLLHAESLQLAHPKTGEAMQFAARLPEDFATIKRSLEEWCLR